MPRFAEDIASALAWLRRQLNIAADQIALLGHLVGAVTTQDSSQTKKPSFPRASVTSECYELDNLIV